MQCVWNKLARPAQISRSASQAVRFSLQSNNLPDAFHIVNSLRYATFNSPPSLKLKLAASTCGPVDSKLAPVVSPRLASHTLLHGLIRAGMPTQASKLADQMMKAGISLRAKSFEAVYCSLASIPKATKPHAPLHLAMSSEALSLRPNASHDEGIRCALHLLQVARQSRQRRTHSMFKTLITLCIINGEIILASLVFGLIVRDYQKQEMSKFAIASTDAPHTAELSSRPSYSRLSDICSSIDQVLCQNHSAPRYEHESALQALANLAYLLDSQSIPFNNVSPLLRSLYSCPRSDHHVWVPNGPEGTLKQRVAYQYFHEVLERLIYALPTRSPEVVLAEPHSYFQDGKMLPALEKTSYNSLLHYALRHRRSFDMAETVLYHMNNIRQPPAVPNISTYNIIERESTILRKDLTRHLLKHGDNKHEISKVDSLLLLIDTRRSNLPLNTYAFTTRIAHLTATSQIPVIIQALLRLFPNLVKSKFGKRDIELAVLLGPVALTSILNALCKSGRTAYAEKIWELACLAEAQSFKIIRDIDGQKVARPWCLPIEAYTIMISVYAAESRKGDERLSGPTFSYIPPTKKALASDPRQRFARKRPSSIPPTRSELGRRMALKIYQSMWTNSESLWERFENLQAGHRASRVEIRKRQMEIPQPDARFFNAVLDLVGRSPRKVPRRRRLKTLCYYLRAERHARRRYAYRDKLAPLPDPLLPMVVEQMTAHGFAVPLILRKFLVGRVNYQPQVEREEKDRRPFVAIGKPSYQSNQTWIPVQRTKRLSLRMPKRRQAKRTRRKEISP